MYQGFFCPVHTPDGAPCGLLNHLTSVCKVITHRSRTGGLPRLLASLGMAPANQSIVYPKVPTPTLTSFTRTHTLNVLAIFGCLLGWHHHRLCGPAPATTFGRQTALFESEENGTGNK